MTIHCGSRGLGHQIGTDYLQRLLPLAGKYGIRLPDRELACAPIRSPEGQDYLGAMRAGINCALANRQVIGGLVRRVFARHFPKAVLTLLYDVSHNTCKVGGALRRRRLPALFVHRKGATRAFGPGHPELPEEFRAVGQPVLIGGTMGTASFVLVGTAESERRAFSSSCHGAGRRMSRTQAKGRWQGKALIRELSERGILVKAHTAKGAAEEAPGAYKDVEEVAAVAEATGLSRRVARVRPDRLRQGVRLGRGARPDPDPRRRGFLTRIARGTPRRSRPRGEDGRTHHAGARPPGLQHEGGRRREPRGPSSRRAGKTLPRAGGPLRAPARPIAASPVGREGASPSRRPKPGPLPRGAPRL